MSDFIAHGIFLPLGQLARWIFGYSGGVSGECKMRPDTVGMNQAQRRNPPIKKRLVSKDTFRSIQHRLRPIHRLVIIGSVRVCLKHRGPEDASPTVRCAVVTKRVKGTRPTISPRIFVLAPTKPLRDNTFITSSQETDADAASQNPNDMIFVTNLCI